MKKIFPIFVILFSVLLFVTLLLWTNQMEKVYAKKWNNQKVVGFIIKNIARDGQIIAAPFRMVQIGLQQIEGDRMEVREGSVFTGCRGEDRKIQTGGSYITLKCKNGIVFRVNGLYLGR